MSITLAATAALLFGCGTWLLLQRRLTRVVIGLGLIAHGANLLLLMSAGDPGEPAFAGHALPSAFTDPLPQALILTAIVISFGATSFLLALARRSVDLTGDDVVENDLEDRLVARAEGRAEDVSDEEAAAVARRALDEHPLSGTPEDLDQR